MKGIGVTLFIALLAASLLTVTAHGQMAHGVSGIVVNREGKPIGGVAVTIYDANKAVVSRAVTDPGGYFLVALLPGTYTLGLSKPGYVERSMTFTISAETFFTSLGTITLDYSLAVSLPIAAISLPVLGTATIPIAISNRGSAVESVRVELTGNCSLVTRLYSGKMEVSAFALSPGDSQSLTLELKTPYMGNAMCLLTVRFVGSVVQERVLRISVVNQSLSMISSHLISIRATPGSVLRVPVKVSNKLPDPFRARLALELPSGWIGIIRDAGGNVVEEVQLSPGESLSATLLLNVPRGAAPRTYPVGIKLTGVDPYFVDRLQLSVTVPAGAPSLHLSTTTPYLSAYAGRSARYHLTVANLGDADCLAVVNVSGLPSGYGWTVTDPEGNVLSQVYLPAGASTTLHLSVRIPPLAEPTTIGFTVSVTAGGSSDRLNLNLGVLGRYELSFVTQSFLMEMTVGTRKSFTLQLRNTGYTSLTNVAVSVGKLPRGFTVSVEPPVILLLKPGETANFTINVLTGPAVDAGDYYITLSVKADQVEPKSRDLRVHVKPTGIPAYVIAAVAIALLAAVILAYRKFGRR